MSYILFLNRISKLRYMVKKTENKPIGLIWKKHLDSLLDLRAEVAHERLQDSARSVH